MQSGISIKNMALFYLTVSNIILATTSGIQLFLKLYFAIDMFASRMDTISFAIFYYNDKFNPSDCL
jgi:hypothetical protein